MRLLLRTRASSVTDSVARLAGTRVWSGRVAGGHAADRGLRGRGCGLLVRSGRSRGTARSSAARYSSRAALPDVPAGALHCDTACHSTPLHSTPLHSSPLHSSPIHSTPLHSACGTAPRVRRSSARRRISSRAALPPVPPTPPEKATAAQLAIDRKKILSRVDVAMSGWEEYAGGEAVELEDGEPSQLEVRDAVVNEMKRTVRLYLESGEAREARDVEMTAMLATLHEWLLSLVDDLGDAKAATAAELGGTTDAPAQAGGAWDPAPEFLVSDERVEAQERRAEQSEQHTGAVLSIITDQQHRLRELASRYKNRPPPPPKPPAFKLSHQESQAEEDLVRVRAQLEQTLTDKVMAQSELGQAKKDAILAKRALEQERKAHEKSKQARAGAESLAEQAQQALQDEAALWAERLDVAQTAAAKAEEATRIARGESGRKISAQREVPAAVLRAAVVEVEIQAAEAASNAAAGSAALAQVDDLREQ
eukprot:scaffold16904_cov72-Phaeocystis_antarctica.AAC.11